MDEYLDLAAHLVEFELDDEVVPADIRELEIRLGEQYGIDSLESFQVLIDHLLPLVREGHEFITNYRVRGFKVGPIWVAKMRVKDE